MTTVETRIEMPASDLDSREARFITFLKQLITDPGQMANLRRGLGKPPGSVAAMHPIILPFLTAADHANDPWDEDRFYLIASLFAFWHQGRSGSTTIEPANLGASLALLAHHSDSIEQRFVALLNCYRDDLPQHLRHSVGLLKSHDVGISWRQLLVDLKGWNWESRSVQREWARGFWRRLGPEDVIAEEN